jgi:hypothetical protein
MPFGRGRPFDAFARAAIVSSMVRRRSERILSKKRKPAPANTVTIRSVFEQHNYSGFDASRAFDIVYGGHFEHRLLSPKLSTMEHQSLVLDDMRVESGHYDFPVIAQGVMPQGAVCFGMVVEGIDLTRTTPKPWWTTRYRSTAPARS